MTQPRGLELEAGMAEAEADEVDCSPSTYTILIGHVIIKTFGRFVIRDN
jgi:hypothetical protein